MNLELKVLLKTFWASNFILYASIIFLLLWKIDTSFEFLETTYVGSVAQVLDYLMLMAAVILEISTTIYCITYWHAHRVSMIYNKSMDEMLDSINGEDEEK